VNLSSLGASLRHILRPISSQSGGLHTHEWVPFGDAGVSQRCTRCGDLLFPGPTDTSDPGDGGRGSRVRATAPN